MIEYPVHLGSIKIVTIAETVRTVVLHTESSTKASEENLVAIFRMLVLCL
jgi:hypothetical protein